MSIPNRKVVLSIMGDTEPYHRPESTDTEPIRLMVQAMDKEQHRKMEIEPKTIDDRWTKSLVRVEGFVKFEGSRCACVATYTVGEKVSYAGVLIIYAH